MTDQRGKSRKVRTLRHPTEPVPRVRRQNLVDQLAQVVALVGRRSRIQQVALVGMIIGAGALVAMFAVVFVSEAIDAWRRPAVTPNPVADLVRAAAVQPIDVGPGWELWKEVVDTARVTGWTFIFRQQSARRQFELNFSEELYYYPDTESASAGYSDWLAHYVPRGVPQYRYVPELDFSHHADSLTTRCLPGEINNVSMLSCSTVARYRQLVVIVLGNVFEDQGLRLADYRTLVEAVDRRAIDALVSTGEP